jgi:hypothetical protein
MRASHVVGRRFGSAPEVVIATFAGLNAVASIAGALGLVSGVLDLGETVESRLPLGSPVLAGVALALLVGLPNSILFVAALRRRPGVFEGAILVGWAMIGWIVVELLVIRELSFFHPVYIAVGLVMIAAGDYGLRRAQEEQVAVAPRSR